MEGIWILFIVLAVISRIAENKKRQEQRRKQRPPADPGVPEAEPAKAPPLRRRGRPVWQRTADPGEDPEETVWTEDVGTQEAWEDPEYREDPEEARRPFFPELWEEEEDPGEAWWTEETVGETPVYGPGVPSEPSQPQPEPSRPAPAAAGTIAADEIGSREIGSREIGSGGTGAAWEEIRAPGDLARQAPMARTVRTPEQERCSRLRRSHLVRMADRMVWKEVLSPPVSRRGGHVR